MGYEDDKLAVDALTYQVAMGHLEGGNKGNKLRQDKRKKVGWGLWVLG